MKNTLAVLLLSLLLVVGCGGSKEKVASNTQEDGHSHPHDHDHGGDAAQVLDAQVLDAHVYDRKLTAEEEKIVGTYENTTSDYRPALIFLGNGKLEVAENFGYEKYQRKQGGGKWKLVEKEVHVIFTSSYRDHSYYPLATKNASHVYRIETTGDLTYIGFIRDGKREEEKAVQLQFSHKRVKDTKPKSETKEPPANAGKALKPEDVVGSYEAGLGGITFRFVLLESGVVENYFNGIKEPEDGKWKIQGAEVHIEKGKSDGTVVVNKIESNGDFTVFARIRNGKREDFQNRTYKKLKSEKETPSKDDDKNSTTANS